MKSTVGARLLGFRSWLCHLLPWASCFMSLSLFLHLLNEHEISSISLIGLLWEWHKLIPRRGFEERLENRKRCLSSN